MTSDISPDVLLVYPPFEGLPFEGRVYMSSIPLGVSYIASTLIDEGLVVQAIDCNIERPSPLELAVEILRIRPRILGVSVTSPSLRYVYELICELRGRGGTSDIPFVVVGGPHITAEPGFRGLGADYYVGGEAEKCFGDLCKRFLSGLGGFGERIDCGFVNELDSINYPARHLFPEGRYRFVSFEASRGCPFDCSYCSICQSIHRKRSIEGIRGELELIDSDGVGSIDFTDDVFTLDRGFSMSIGELMGEFGLKWACTTRADIVDRELIDYFSAKGCKQISFGVESGSERLRYSIGKRISNRSYVEAFRYARDAGVRTRAYALLGLPGERECDMRKTFGFINKLDPDEVFYSPTILFPGSRLMRESVREGSVDSDVWLKYMFGECGMPVFCPEGYDLETIYGLCDISTREFYLRPRYILKRMRYANSVEDLMECFKAGFYCIAKPFLTD